MRLIYNRNTSSMSQRRNIIESHIELMRDALTYQHLLILDGLLEATVNSFTMRAEMGVMNPSARVKELQYMGFIITTEMKPLKKPDGTITDFAYYTLRVCDQ